MSLRYQGVSLPICPVQLSPSHLYHIHNLALEELRVLKNRLAILKEKMTSIREWLEDVLEDDEVMALMNLKRFSDEPQLYVSPLVPTVLQQHEEVEDLLEPYLTDTHSLEAVIEVLREDINNSEDLLLLRLDTARNEILIANTVIATVAANIALGGFVAGVFGMNLDNTIWLQEYTYGFAIVVTCMLSFMSLGIVFSLYYFKSKGILP